MSKTWAFFKKSRWVFRKKILNVFKIAKGSKFAVKCDQNSKISQNVQSSSFLKKEIGFSKKKLSFFKSAKGRKFVKCD